MARHVLEQAWVGSDVLGDGRRPEVPVIWLHTRRLYGREGVPLSRIRWSRTRLVPISREDEDLWLYRKQVPVSDPFEGVPATVGLPDLAFLVDSSESMGWDPEAGQGRYDLVLRSIYAVWQKLATFFSSSTSKLERQTR